MTHACCRAYDSLVDSIKALGTTGVKGHLRSLSKSEAKRGSKGQAQLEAAQQKATMMAGGGSGMFAKRAGAAAVPAGMLGRGGGGAGGGAVPGMGSGMVPGLAAAVHTPQAPLAKGYDSSGSAGSGRSPLATSALGAKTADLAHMRGSMQAQQMLRRMVHAMQPQQDDDEDDDDGW